MATKLNTPEVSIDLIDVVKGHNPRKKFDRAELLQLAETIKETGVISPISVRKKENGRFDLVTGERRLRAAKIAGKKKIGITLSTGNRHLEALVENIHRSNLTPIETALGLKAIAEEHNLETNKEIAAKVRKGEAWVGAHLRLLKLPKVVQRYIADGDVPMEAEPVLRPIAEVSPQIAEFLCEAAKREELSGKRFLDRFGELFEKATAIEGMKDVPTMIPLPRFELSEAIPDLNPDKKEHKELIERAIGAFYRYRPYHLTDPVIELAEAEIDAARAAGVLVEHVEGDFVRSRITDAKFAADLVERAIERRQAEREEEARQQELLEAQRKEERKGERQRDRKARAERGELSPQAQAKADAEQAVRFNDRLGRNLIERRSGGKNSDHDLNRFKAIANLFLEQNPTLAGRGLRFTMDKLREVERKPLKKGGVKVRVTYATDEECTAELWRRIHTARNASEALEILSEAMLAATLADNKAEPASRRPHWSYEGAETVKKFLKAEVKAARPRKSRKLKQTAKS